MLRAFCCRWRWRPQQKAREGEPKSIWAAAALSAVAFGVDPPLLSISLALIAEISHECDEGIALPSVESEPPRGSLSKPCTVLAEGTVRFTVAAGRSMRHLNS